MTSGPPGAPLIQEVRSRRDARAYLSLFRRPYEDDPWWVHPDVRVAKDLLRRRGRLAARSEWRALLAVEDREPVAALTVFLHE
ncbi:MAG: hypothetical protein ACREQ9_09215, partial [Candidatus Binatia bacterium]